MFKISIQNLQIKPSTTLYFLLALEEVSILDFVDHDLFVAFQSP